MIPTSFVVPNWVNNRAESVLLTILSAGPIPKHVAFVMDGNRRYARRMQKEIQQGHADGFLTLRRMLEICYRLGIRCVTAYAFSIENFKRSPEEVDALMALAEDKMLELCRNGELLEQYGVRLNVIGNKDLLPPNVLDAARKAEALTRRNSKAIFNLCMPYTSRDEMASAIQSVVRNAIDDPQSIEDITEKAVDDQLFTSLGGSPPLDILIRTSGVQRLSDFLLWQCCEDTQLQFSATYWPDFGLWDFIPIIFDYQRKIWSQ